MSCCSEKTPKNKELKGDNSETKIEINKNLCITIGSLETFKAHLQDLF
jgi:hypothetical protein